MSLFNDQLDVDGLRIIFLMRQVCVDVFVTTQTYVDIASISVIPRTTGGQVYVNVFMALFFKYMIEVLVFIVCCDKEVELIYVFS